MRRIILLTTALLFFITAGYSSNRVLQFDDLPIAARQFIKKYFATERLAYVKNESRGIGRGYDVKMLSGTEIEFDSNGAWTDIDCVRRKVPTAAVPESILSYVRKHYRGSWITAIERTTGRSQKHEVKLSNGLKLEFDKSYRLKNIDD